MSRQIKCGGCKRQFAVEQTAADKQDLHCPYCQAPIPHLPPETVAEAVRRGFYGQPPPMDEGDDPR